MQMKQTNRKKRMQETHKETETLLIHDFFTLNIYGWNFPLHKRAGDKRLRGIQWCISVDDKTLIKTIIREGLAARAYFDVSEL